MPVKPLCWNTLLLLSITLMPNDAFSQNYNNAECFINSELCAGDGKLNSLSKNDSSIAKTTQPNKIPTQSYNSAECFINPKLCTVNGKSNSASQKAGVEIGFLYKCKTDKPTIIEIQTAAQALGLYKSSIDGLAGKGTTGAIKEAKKIIPENRFKRRLCNTRRSC